MCSRRARPRPGPPGPRGPSGRAWQRLPQPGREGRSRSPLDGDETLAVVEFFSREGAHASAGLMRSLAMMGHQLGQFLQRRRAELGPTSLTAREMQVLQLAAHGAGGPQIAAALVVSPATVKSHFEHIYAKLGVSDRAAAVAVGLRSGLIH